MNNSKLCLAFQMISERTWHRMKNNKMSGIKIGEETITETNLQDLDLLKLPYFHVWDFSKYQESHETGADWEWWFVDNNFYYGMAVQAKKLNEDDHTYSIDYKPQKTQYFQIKRLLDYSKRMNLTPSYCFYSYWELLGSIDSYWPCPSIGYKRELWGCSIAHGLTVYKLFKMGKKSITDIIPISQPLHCFTCCPGIWHDPHK